MVVSRLHEQKSIDDIIKAFSIIIKEFQDWKLVIIGMGNQEDKLHKLAIKLGIFKKIKWIQKTKHISLYYEECSIFCLAQNMKVNLTH